MSNQKNGRGWIALMLLPLAVISADAAKLRITSDCSHPEEYYNDFTLREMSFRMDNGTPSVRIYARNSEKKNKVHWNPLEWTRKMKLTAVSEELPADVVIRFEKGQVLEALNFYSVLSSLFHGKKLDVVRTCGGEVDTGYREEISLKMQWGQEGSIRFW